MFDEKFVLHADPHPGNFLFTPEGKIGILGFGCMREYEPWFCDNWLDVLVAKWKHRKEDLRDVFDRLGCVSVRGIFGATERKLNEIAEITLAPFLYNRTFDWGEWHPQSDLNPFFRGNLNVFRYASAPKSVFYFRVALGVWGFLQRSYIKGNWYEMAQEVSRRRGRL